MRTSHQKGTLRAAGKGRWELGYRTVEGKQTTHTIMAKSKAAARIEADNFLAPINVARRDRQKNAEMTLGSYIENFYIPFGLGGKWKPSTAGTTMQRLRQYLVNGELGTVAVAKLDRTMMQSYLNRHGLLSYSVVNHLRFDLKGILKLAVADGLAPRNQADALHTPQTCEGPAQPVMTPDQVQAALACLDLRERLFCRFAVYAGMRPGEIIALRWSDINGTTALVDDRWYRGKQGTPKGRGTGKVRKVALSPAVVRDLLIWQNWRTESEFIFGSENPATPIKYENLWQREIRPRFRKLGLAWADFRCMRRTNSTLMKAAGADVKVSADQRGHGVNVALSEYTHSTDAQKAEAVEKLEGLIQ